jgi:hypothetical protein
MTAARLQPGKRAIQNFQQKISVRSVDTFAPLRMTGFSAALKNHLPRSTS